VRVDKEEIYDILDQMRATIPEEIKQARWIVKERQEMLAEAKREAERIVKEARERQTQLISEQEVTKQAERAAEDIIEDARAREREIRLGAEDYADEILNTLEVNLSKFIAAVQRGRERLQGKDEPAEVGVAVGRVTPPSRSSTPTSRPSRSTPSPTRPTRGCCTAAASPARSRGPAARDPGREPIARAPVGLGEAVETTAGRAARALGHPRRRRWSSAARRRPTSSAARRPRRWKAEELGRPLARPRRLRHRASAASRSTRRPRIEADEVRRHLEAGSGLERIVFAVRGEAAHSAFARALQAERLEHPPSSCGCSQCATNGRSMPRRERPPPCRDHRARPMSEGGSVEAVIAGLGPVGWQLLRRPRVGATCADHVVLGPGGAFLVVLHRGGGSVRPEWADEARAVAPRWPAHRQPSRRSSSSSARRRGAMPAASTASTSCPPLAWRATSSPAATCSSPARSSSCARRCASLAA
jgi:hypothetical protein